MLNGKTVILGVSGGIAAYKSCEIASQLKKLSADLWVVMTKNARQFITPLTFRTLSAHPVLTDLFDEELLSGPVLHVSLAQKADLILIAPATANLIGKIAGGIADDLLSTLVIASKAPRLIAPAMNSAMWENKIVQENMQKLKKLGYQCVEPSCGRLVCGDEGVGKLAQVDEIVNAAVSLLKKTPALRGKKVLVTAGGTREFIDPVRFIGNPSSGKMGYALAKAAAEQGAEVTLISGPTQLTPPENVNFISVTSAEQLYQAVMENYTEADTVVMAAAVSDYQPAQKLKGKIKKHQELKLKNIKLQPTKDILAELGQKKEKRKLIGFALETNNLVKNAKKKLKEKNLDLIVANTPAAFESDTSSVKLIYRDGTVENLGVLSKQEIAQRIISPF